MILSANLRFLYALVSHLCQTGLPEVAMPSSDMWQECKITLQHTRPYYAKSSYRSVDPQTFMETSTRPTTYQMYRPTPSWQQCSHCDSVEANHRSRSLESDATVPAEYALTTTTTTIITTLSHVDLQLSSGRLQQWAIENWYTAYYSSCTGVMFYLAVAVSQYVTVMQCTVHSVPKQLTIKCIYRSPIAEKNRTQNANSDKTCSSCLLCKQLNIE